MEDEDPISEKSNESDEEEKKLEIKAQNTNTEEDNETKSNIFKTTNYAKHNNSENMEDFLFKDKKSFNRYSDTGTLNISNIENIEKNSEESSNNIVNFLGISKDNPKSNNTNTEDEEEEKEYLNKKINKKYIQNKEDVIEIIPEKKEEEDESEEPKDSARLTIKNFVPRNSSVQFTQAKILEKRTSLSLKNSGHKGQYLNSILPALIKRTVSAEHLIKVVNNKKIRYKIDEKIKKMRDEIPDLKSKYEMYMEEEKKEDYKINEENKENEENHEQVKDWFEGILP